MIRLMIKEHLVTKLKYLCKSERIDYELYTGSGTRWLSHLKIHGKFIKTTVLFETEDKNLFKQTALYYSELFNVVKDPAWANCIPEQGEGGNTVSTKMWITDGISEKYIEKALEIPEGWYKGRNANCSFKDIERQKENASKVDIDKRNLAIKQAWINKDQNGLGTRRVVKLFGENSPTKRADVRAKMKNSALLRPEQELKICPICGLARKYFGNRHLRVCK